MISQEERQKYQKIQIYIWALQQETWPLETINKDQVEAEIIRIAQLLGLTLEPSDPQFLSTLSQKVFEILSTPPEQPTPTLPPSEILKLDLEGEIKKNQEKKLNLIYPTLNEQIKKIQKQYTQKIADQLTKKEVKLNQNPLLKEIISQEVSLKIANDLPQVARSQIFKENEYQQVIEKNKTIIANEFQKIGLNPKKIINDQKFSQIIKDTTFENSQTIAATPRNTVAVEKIIEIKKPASEIKEIHPPLPKEILIELNQPQEAVILPALYLLHPKIASAAAQKTITTLPVNFLKIAVENAPLDWQENPKWPVLKETILNYVFTEDIQSTINFLKGKGLKENHPLIQILEKKLWDFQAVQKDPKTGKDLPWVKILKRNAFFDELLGRKKVFNQDLNGYLITNRKPLWEQKGSFGYYLHQGINKLRFISDTSQKLIKFLTRGKYPSVGVFVRRVIYQRVIKPIFVKLGKTAVGKAIKTGVKKFSVWLAAKLGIQIGTKAVAAAAAPETMGISLAVSLAIDAALFMFNMIKRGISFLKRAWIEMSENPEKAITYLILGGAILIPIFISEFLPFAPVLIPTLITIGAPLALSGGAALLINILKTASLGSTATALSTQTAVAAATSGGHIVLGSILGVGVGTLIVTQITSSAFLIPEQEEFAGSPYIQLNKTGQFNGDEETGKGTITYRVTIGAKDKDLNEVKIDDKISTHCLDGQPEIISIKPIKSPPSIINTSYNWETTYTIGTKDDFKDCLIINKITVQAKIENQPEEIQEKTITYVMKIGNPPDDCPYGWPTTGTITSLPGDLRENGRRHSGIDIANNEGTPIYNTHKGYVSSGDDGDNKGRGKYVEIVGSCDNKIFKTVYYHLSEIKISSGNIFSCEEIGKMGNTGRTYGENGGYHLHYEIIGLGDDWWTSGRYFTKPNKNDFVKNSCLTIKN